MKKIEKPYEYKLSLAQGGLVYIFISPGFIGGLNAATGIWLQETKLVASVGFVWGLMLIEEYASNPHMH